jgi:lysozyme
MKTGTKGIALIKEKEEFRAKWYWCPAHKPTIGYGHVIQEDEQHLYKATLTEAQAHALLLEDLGLYERGVTKAFTVPLTQAQYDALVSFTYNVGVGCNYQDSTTKKWIKRGLLGSTLRQLINQRAAPAAIKAAWLAWCKMDGTRNGKDDDGDGLVDEAGEKQIAAGLLKRRTTEADMFLAGYVASGK